MNIILCTNKNLILKIPTGIEINLNDKYMLFFKMIIFGDNYIVFFFNDYIGMKYKLINNIANKSNKKY